MKTGLVVGMLFVPASLLLSCGGGASLRAPATPVTASVAPPVAGPVTILAVGATNTGALHASDPYCRETDPEGTALYPCQRYQVTAPSDGRLDVHVDWANPDNLIALEGPVLVPMGSPMAFVCCSSPDRASFQLHGGRPYVFYVQWEGNRSQANLDRTAAQDFTLTTSFAANAQ